jgi:hypothetical protein
MGAVALAKSLGAAFIVDCYFFICRDQFPDRVTSSGGTEQWQPVVSSRRYG